MRHGSPRKPVVAYIDGERTVFDVEDARDTGPAGSIEIETEGGESFLLFETREEAGEAAKERWGNMAEYDPEEFRMMVGEETLIRWALGRWAGPGMEKTRSLREWLDEVVANHPEEEFASYDCEEREFASMHPDFSDYTVAYRTD